MKTHTFKASMVQLWRVRLSEKIDFLKRFAQQQTTPYSLTPADGVEYWQDRVLLMILFSALVISPAALIPGFWLFISSDAWGIVLIDSLALGTGLLFMRLRWLPFRIRAFSCVGAIYVIAMALCIVAGPFGTRLIWLFMVPVVTILLIDLRAALLTMGLNMVTLFIFGLWIYTARMPWSVAQALTSPIEDWIVTTGNFILLNTMTVLSISYIFRGLEKVLKQEKSISESHRRNLVEMTQVNKKLVEEISIRAKAEEAVIASEKKHEMLMTQMNEGVVIVNLKFRVSYFNRKVEQISGYSIEDLRHQSALSFIKLEGGLSEREGKQNRTLLITESLEISLLCKNGDRIPMLASGTPFSAGESGEGLIIILTDISKLKTVEKNLKVHQEKIEERTVELEVAKAETESAYRAKSEFLANISHELRTPMHHILNYAKFGVTKVDKLMPEKISYYFTQIQSAGNKMMLLLNNLLELSTLESNLALFETESIDIYSLINYSIVDSTHTLEEKGISIDLPHRDAQINVLCDPVKIKTVLKSLLSNAIKYSPNGSVISISHSVSLLNRLCSDTPGLEIVISDKGIGIPREELSEIFKTFSQSTRTKNGSGGTGLGLSICKHVIRGHKGEIWAESGSDEGTAVHFTLPLAG